MGDFLAFNASVAATLARALPIPGERRPYFPVVDRGEQAILIE